MQLLLSIILFLFPSISFSQIKVDKAGDGWDQKIDSALVLIKQTDIEKYQLIDSVCNRIEFWSSGFSSNEGSYGNKGTILVAIKDVQLNSINNLAVVLVHESLHLHVLQKGYIIIPEQEEAWCYRYELGFIDKLKNPEPWLKQHAIKQLTNIQK
jgi:hypothetical protein